MLLELINICLVGRYKTYILHILVPSREYSDACGTSFDILRALKREDSHGTAPLGWDIVVYDVTTLLNSDF